MVMNNSHIFVNTVEDYEACMKYLKSRLAGTVRGDGRWVHTVLHQKGCVCIRIGISGLIVVKTGDYNPPRDSLDVSKRIIKEARLYTGIDIHPSHSVIACNGIEEAHAVVEWVEDLTNQGVWAALAFLSDLKDAPEIYVLVPSEGEMLFKVTEPDKSLDRIEVTFKRTVKVTHTKKIPGITIVNGKKYYTKDLQAALVKCEVKGDDVCL